MQLLELASSRLFLSGGLHFFFVARFFFSVVKAFLQAGNFFIQWAIYLPHRNFFFSYEKVFLQVQLFSISWLALFTKKMGSAENKLPLLFV